MVHVHMHDIDAILSTQRAAPNKPHTHTHTQTHNTHTSQRTSQSKEAVLNINRILKVQLV